MIRRRLYNPAQLTADELKASFLARQDSLEEMLRLVGEQTPGRPCQHMMLIGPRGMGKTTLALRLLHEIRDAPHLNEIWQPVAFDEESYGVGDLADFWLAALHHLTRATGNQRWAEKADALVMDEKDTERLAAYSLAALTDFCQTSGKRLILFVDNLDVVFKQFRDERDVYALRAVLIERSEILLIGSANTVFEAIRGHHKPFYEFFRIFILEGLGPDETFRILKAHLDCVDKSDLQDVFSRDRGRLETVRRLTGGNPRLLGLACRMLIESPFDSAFEDIERLIDEQTPYFKARIEELPAQSRKVFHCLAEGWRPMLTREVAESAKLSSSHTSAQLRLLVDKGYATEVRLSGEKRTRYEVSDRFYNIYYLLRFSYAGRDRLKRLVSFLHDFFGPIGMRTMYPRVLQALHRNVMPAEQLSDLLGVWAYHISQDEDFEKGDEWLLKAIVIAQSMIGAEAPVVGEIHKALISRLDLSRARTMGWVKYGDSMYEDFRFEAAEAAYRHAVEDDPQDARAWLRLGYSLSGMDRGDDALAAFTQVQDIIDGHDTVKSRNLAAETLLAKGHVFLKLNRQRSAADVLHKVSELINPDDSEKSRIWAVLALRAKVNALSELDEGDESIATFQQITEYIYKKDSPNIRHIGAWALGCADINFPLLKTQHKVLTKHWQQALDCVRADDPDDRKESIVRTMAATAKRLNSAGRYDLAEATCRKTTEVEPTHEQSWRVLAEAILLQEDDTRLSEAEACARRAVALVPESTKALRTLFRILAYRGRWATALDCLEQALRTGGYEFEDREWLGLTESLIQASAVGYGEWVKRLMIDTGLAQRMEPLWHTLRAELGEDLEPLPAEIVEAMSDIKQMLAQE